MTRPLTITFGALLLSLLITSCHAMTPTVAERCVLIDLQGQAGKKLIPMLDTFAEAHGLIPDKSHPISPSYERREGKSVYADLIYTIGMGRFGAELSLFRFDPSRNADLVAAFDVFVQQRIAPKYKVTRCADTPDYQLPEVYR